MENVVVVSHKLLSEEACQSIIDEFVLREGTDYGHREWTLLDKRRAVLRQLDAGYLKLVYDHKSQTCNLIEA